MLFKSGLSLSILLLFGNALFGHIVKTGHAAQVSQFALDDIFEIDSEDVLDNLFRDRLSSSSTEECIDSIADIEHLLKISGCLPDTLESIQLYLQTRFPITTTSEVEIAFGEQSCPWTFFVEQQYFEAFQQLAALKYSSSELHSYPIPKTIEKVMLNELLNVFAEHWLVFTRKAAAEKSRKTNLFFVKILLRSEQFRLLCEAFRFPSYMNELGLSSKSTMKHAFNSWKKDYVNNCRADPLQKYSFGEITTAFTSWYAWKQRHYSLFNAFQRFLTSPCLECFDDYEILKIAREHLLHLQDFFTRISLDTTRPLMQSKMSCILAEYKYIFDQFSARVNESIVLCKRYRDIYEGPLAYPCTIYELNFIHGTVRSLPHILPDFLRLKDAFDQIYISLTDEQCKEDPMKSFCLPSQGSFSAFFYLDFIKTVRQNILDIMFYFFLDLCYARDKSYQPYSNLKVASIKLSQFPRILLFCDRIETIFLNVLQTRDTSLMFTFFVFPEKLFTDLLNFLKPDENYDLSAETLHFIDSCENNISSRNDD